MIFKSWRDFGVPSYLRRAQLEDGNHFTAMKQCLEKSRKPQKIGHFCFWFTSTIRTKSGFGQPRPATKLDWSHWVPPDRLAAKRLPHMARVQSGMTIDHESHVTWCNLTLAHILQIHVGEHLRILTGVDYIPMVSPTIFPWYSHDIPEHPLPQHGTPVVTLNCQHHFHEVNSSDCGGRDVCGACHSCCLGRDNYCQQSLLFMGNVIWEILLTWDCHCHILSCVCGKWTVPFITELDGWFTGENPMFNGKTNGFL